MKVNRNTMKIAFATIASALVVMVVALLASPASAQETFSRTITEQEINDSYRVANPRRAALSNVFVDLQPNQVQITADHTTRRQGTITTTSTMQPYIEDGRVYWTVTSIVAADGQQVSDALLTQINAVIETAWRNYIRSQFEGVVDTIIITDSDLTLTGTLDGSRAEEVEERVEDAVEEGVENGTINEEDTPGLFRWFQNRNP